ncbi:DNA-binding transcriptional ArsR family regulator [Pseudogracilibacillus auburnensis]|uniref:DNA-binding transcriptional ArsR family regulator n=2 Tax=Pseudogracilibacillus auburnensis TaxID=1494959 RepID=A0A2V3VZJ1_9BACI|nr:DNA-binding transcriptional ArsR family regulator [Pseudogracilibacillus auburnensis]
MVDHTDEFYFDKGKVDQIKPLMSDVNDVELIFKALADPTRLKIAYALTLTEELCVNDVAHIIDATTATASHHLRLLRHMKLAKYRKEGKVVFYSLDDDHVRQLVYIAMVHAKEGE